MNSSEFEWVSNNIIDNTMYKCKKTKISLNYIPRICSWEGTLAEYIQHVKSKHDASFFVIPNKPQKFEWKLPFISDQTDLGIFQHDLGHFLYEIYFKQSSGEIYFSLAHLDKLRDNFKVFYKILLCNENGTEASFIGQANVEYKDILKSVEEQTHNITIGKDIVLKYLYQGRVFQWHIAITVTANIAEPTKTILVN